MQPMFGNNTVQDLQKLSSHDVGMLVYNTFTDGHVAFFIAFLSVEELVSTLYTEKTLKCSILSPYCTTFSNMAYMSVSVPWLREEEEQ